ncbi:MAG: hypothetical protein JXA44_06465 [Methanospirillaceae archaeon]|nr:hypothetical protein [Methanospirillaceae archaeon]
MMTKKSLVGGILMTLTRLLWLPVQLSCLASPLGITWVNRLHLMTCSSIALHGIWHTV